MRKRVLIGLGVLALVVVAAAGGYLYGVTVGEARANQIRQRFAQGRFTGQGDQTPAAAFQRGLQGGAPPGGGVVGTIQAIEGDTLVLQTGERTVRVKTTDTTLIEKLTSVGVEALETGEQVVVTGSENADGSVTARSIQSLRGFRGQQPDEP
ncbi:MAG: DUF5666 domain-containing protein [Anaerolineae bacterium]|nr:DUF5666 domain-containing protein [Anaerolineae bacterium]